MKKDFDFEFTPFGDQEFNPAEPPDEELHITSHVEYITVSELCEAINDTERVQLEVEKAARQYGLAAAGTTPVSWRDLCEEAAPTSLIKKKVDVDFISLNIKASIQRWKSLTRCPKHKAFTIPAMVYNEHNDRQIKVPRHHIAGDQGSDLNVIYPDMRQALGLRLIEATKLGFDKMSMAIADGSTVPLTHWVISYINVCGIMREIWAVVCSRKKVNMALLLGLPFLDDIRAIIDIHAQTIQIGNPAIGEEPRLIEAPEITKSDPPKPTLDVEDVLNPEEIAEMEEAAEGSDNDEYDQEATDEELEQLTSEDMSRGVTANQSNNQRF